MATGIALRLGKSVTDGSEASEDCDIGFLVDTGLVRVRKGEIDFT
jgi:hypothetical protein